METTLDLQRIQKLAKERDDENWEFRAFLKGIDLPAKKLDALVRRIYAEVSAQIDCTQCANCCQKINPVLDQADVARFAQGLGLARAEFQAKYLRPDQDQPFKACFSALPCPFLKQKRCSNYDFRPEDCRSYPHLHKRDFGSRLWGVIENYEICPIVFNVYEQLKLELWRDNEFEDDFEWE